ncbi:MAG TPA: quinol:electron acceptor oxidoreductase subunit ActD [Thermoanaerobaculia bacterium]|nr:quinol:electron acceptor oxidoreductase subunit ActD [Thermoanaerobaculia bacterium]
MSGTEPESGPVDHRPRPMPGDPARHDLPPPPRGGATLPLAVTLALFGAALGAASGFLALVRLPALYHPLFGSTRFERATGDGFFLSIESWEPRFAADETAELLRRLGASQVEWIAS